MNNRQPFYLLVLLLILYITGPATASAQAGERLRTVVLTDIENEPDDAQSLVRFLTYANQWDIEGIIATTSTHSKDKIADWRIHEILKAYQKVQPNLLKHEKGYPSYNELREKVKKGLPVYGMNGVGEGHDSEGSEWIIRSLEKEDNRPLWIQVWGGPNTLAQALWKIRHTKAPAEAEKLYSKVRVYTISDQDDSGPWIRKEFPNLFYICSPGFDNKGGYHHATWPGISGDTFLGRFQGANRDVISKEWLRQNIQQGHGPLGAEYPDVAYLMEGDTPSFLYLIPNGLNSPENPNYGGWGGRYEFYTPRMQKWFLMPETRPFWTDAVDEYFSPVDESHHTSNKVTVWRWREEFQNDFAARMDWCVKSYKEANHPPVPMLAHPENITLKAGEELKLSAKGTTDPDKDALAYTWFHYPEPGTYGSYEGAMKIENANAMEAKAKMPEVEVPQTVHFILKVTDNGSPALTRYKRVIVSILPE
ncbi:DUF1593 domain-containing protein [Pontibacter saemangeumensis]|uniref:DUF1593 domain-containing protein n=1 Tax=Pontibacter saemangeumensis TaxID=1084525 RepID=A0ABP8M094_9BACT